MGKIKLVSLDLDGTLLSTGKNISGYTCDIVKRCGDQGIIIAVATGRNAKDCERYLSYIKPDLIITSDGCVTKYGGEIISRTAIPVETVNELLRRCLASPVLTGFTADVDKGYLTESYYYPDKPLSFNNQIYEWLTDFSKGIDCGAYKIGMNCGNIDILKNIISGLPNIRISNPDGDSRYEIIPAGVNKWTALCKAAVRLSVNADEIAAFGDSLNDMEIIMGAGFGIAMGNAKAELKAAAKFIADTNDNDGVAKWLEEYAI